MSVNFSWGLYFANNLFQISADLNVDFEYYKKLKELLRIKKVNDFNLVRVGVGRSDGGYIMLQDFQDTGIAYSFGISNDVSWDSIMVELDYQVYMYDHTIDALPYEKAGFHYFKEGIAGIDRTDAPLKTLKHFIERNAHKDNKNMILKMDVEGAEWEFLETVDFDTLKQFDQIVFELHDIVRANTSGYGKILSLLEKINKTHSVIHVHGNNSGCLLKVGDTIFPDVLEVSYVNNNKYEIIDGDDNIMLPIELDAPNDQGRKDIVLGAWNKPLKV